MTLLGGLFERRSGLESPAMPLTSTALLEWLGGYRMDSGVLVSERSSLHMPAVWRSVSLIAHVSSALPLRTYQRGTKNRAPAGLIDDPHPELTGCELWRLSYAHRVLWGNSYIQKVRNRAGQIKELWPITPDRVQVDRVPPHDGIPGGKLFAVTDDWGTRHDRTSREILHIPGLGYDGTTGLSAVRAAAQGIGLAQAAEKSGARFFGSGNILGGVLKTDQRLQDAQAKALKARWQAMSAGLSHAHEVAVLDSGASFQPVMMPHKDAQFLESRRFQVSEIARMFGVPLFLLMETEKSTSWGTGLEQQAIGWVTFDLNPTWLTPTEQRITKELADPGVYAKYTVEGLLRGDSRSRAEFYRVMREVGAFSANDIRDLEDRPPVDGGDTYLQPLNMAPLGSTPDPDPGPPGGDDQDEEDGEDDGSDED